MEQKNTTKSAAEKYKQRKQNRENQKKTNKLVLLIGVPVLLLVLLFVMAFSRSTVYGGVKVAGVSVSGCTVQEAEQILTEKFGSSLPQITVTVGENTKTISSAEVARFDMKKTAEAAMQKGRANLFSRLFTYITPFISRDIGLEYTFDQQKMNDILSELESQLPGAFQATTFVPNENELVITTGHAGKGIDIEKLSVQICSNLDKGKDVNINAQVYDKPFRQPTTEDLQKDIKSEAKDAYFDTDSRKIVPHVTGYKLDKSKTESVLKNAKPDATYKVPLSATEPKITAEELEAEMFSDKLGSYTTRYNASQTDRSHNVALAAEKLDGYIMLPGDVFSYNDVVGNRTAEAGFRNAAVYTANGVENGIGGGICQVSSTLYNAVLYANLEIVSRTNHSYPVSYTPKGQDATVSWGAIDFKFRNDTDHPIRLKTHVGGGDCVVSIYGVMDEEFSVTVESTVLSSTPFEIEYTDDPEMEAGKEKVEREGMIGYSVKTVRTVTKNGKSVTKEMPKSTYRTLSQKVIRGTKEEEPIENTETTTPPTDGSASATAPSAETSLAVPQQ